MPVTRSWFAGLVNGKAVFSSSSCVSLQMQITWDLTRHEGEF